MTIQRGIPDLLMQKSPVVVKAVRGGKICCKTVPEVELSDSGINKLIKDV